MEVVSIQRGVVLNLHILVNLDAPRGNNRCLIPRAALVSLNRANRAFTEPSQSLHGALPVWVMAGTAGVRHEGCDEMKK